MDMNQSRDQPKAVLLIGAGGMLGKAWRKLLDEQDIPCLAPASRELDITRASDIGCAITPAVSLVINCAGWTDVDGAQQHVEQAMAANADGPALLARRCAQTGSTLIHYSTDYVFDGQAVTPYAVDHPIAPLGVYGQSKAKGEAAIQSARCKHLIIRTSWLYAPWGRNFVRTIARLGREKPSLKVVHDQVGRPTSVFNLAEGSWQLQQKQATGIFHLTDEGQCSWYDFAREIIRLDGSDCDVQPCTTDEFPRPAPRPAWSVLDLAKTTAIVGQRPHWHDALKNVFQQMEPLS